MNKLGDILNAKLVKGLFVLYKKQVIQMKFYFIIGKSYKHFSNTTYVGKKEKQILKKKIYDFLISCIKISIFL